MWSSLHVPWRNSRRTPSPTSAPQRTSETESVFSFPEDPSTVAGIGHDEPCYINSHPGPISSVRFLPDGKYIVIGGIHGAVRQWKAEDDGGHSNELEKLVHSEEISAAAVSRDGQWVILAGTASRTVTIWGAATCERVVECLEAHQEKITALDVSTDASRIASGSRDGAVIVWCLKTGRRIAGPFERARSVLSVRFSPAGDSLAIGGSDFTIHVWSICGNSDIHVACIPTDSACSLAWSNDGNYLFAGCHRGSILCFDVSGSSPACTTRKWTGHIHFDSVSTLCLSNNGKFIVSASSSECSVKIWDARTQSEIISLQHDSEIMDAEISHDDSHLVTGTKEGTIYIRNLKETIPPPYFFYSFHTSMVLPIHLGPFPILTEINNAAYFLWRKGELANAEQILSSEIERGSSHLHDHLASRALIRARLQRWDMALDDVQTSFSIEPTLVARLVKSIVLSGQGQHSAVTEALNDALESCEPEEKDFVHVVKAIILFDSGHGDEAICHVNDLAIRSPNVRQSCAFVQARMYTLLARKAVSNQQHARAMPMLAQARDICPSDQCLCLDALSLISGWNFDGLKLEVYRQSCEACCAAGLTQELLDIIRKTADVLKTEVDSRSEQNAWFIDIKSRCAEMLESQGDEAIQSKEYDSAIAHYSAALDMVPVMPETLFVKRSEARMASCLWLDSLMDAEEAIKLNPLSPWGYERKHAALHKLRRYGEAIDALKAMISILENSPDPELRRLRGHYVNPSDTKKVILDVLRNIAHNSPFRLIDTRTGRLCDAEKRRTIFIEDPIFEELISSMATELQQERIKAITREYFDYVMLSHRWEAEELELADVLNKSVYDLDASPSATKLQRFCHIARDSNFRWAWSDTCCIDKDRDVEFEKSINSMFRWYRRSATTIVYLTGVPPQLIPGALKGSVWMKRGWTLQELLAPPVIRFYCQDWTLYLNDTSPNHKNSAVILQELEDATGVAKRDLLTLRPRPEDIQVKLRLASTRETTVPVDMAYGLFGIFGVTMPVIHGESQQNVLGRLFQAILARSGDVSCLAWAGRSSEFNSAFPDHIRVYQHPRQTIPYIDEEDMERRVVDLRRTFTREDETQAMAFYQRLMVLPPVRCADQHLYLPCVVFPLTTLRKVKRTDGVRVYRATASALRDMEIVTSERFVSKGQRVEDLVLACPWIHELLGATPHDHRRDQRLSGEGGSCTDSESDSDSEWEQGQDACTEEPPLACRGDSVHSVPTDTLPDERDTSARVLKLVARFRQSEPLGALLLLAQGHGKYKRVAPDHEIMIQIREEVSLSDMVLQTLDVI